MNEKRCCQSEVAAIFLGLWCLFVGPAAEVRAEAGELAAEWALQPLTDPAPPEVRNTDWVRSPVDRFILARLEAVGLEPAPAAAPAAALRRLSQVLTGLPPSLAEIECPAGGIAGGR